MKYLLLALILTACTTTVAPPATPTPSPTPIATVTPSPTTIPTSTPSATVTPTPTPKPSVTPTVTPTSTPVAGPVIPSTATVSSNIDLIAAWNCVNNNIKGCVHDAGTVGTANGNSSLVSTPSRNGKQSRLFSTTYTADGGERYSASFANNPTATNFVFEDYIWIDSSSTGILANMELDMNQVLSTGDVIIYGFQCDGWSNTWDYSVNTGTIAAHKTTWAHSTAPCNPKNWARNTWNHVQISYSRDASGNITFNSVWFNGVEAKINKTALGQSALAWAKGDLLVNFQVDGGDATGGSLILYSSGMTVSYW